MARTATAPAPAVHKVTGLPVQPVEVLAVGDLVTEAFLSDGSPAVVVAVSANAVWVRPVRFVLGNVTENSHVNYMDDTTLVIDPASIDEAIALGKGDPSESHALGRTTHARKYVLRVSKHAAGAPGSGDWPSFAEQERVGAPAFHRTRWALPGGGAGSLSKGARYRRDPHV